MFETLPPLSLCTKRIFAIDSCDEYIALILKQNGWKQMSRSSSIWNLKWTWKTNPKQHENLRNGQFINHFKGSDQITTKLGLSLLYKKSPVILDTGKSFTSFYPRSYNLSLQKEEFIKDFNNTAIFNLLKKIVVCLELFHFQQYESALKQKIKIRTKGTQHLISQLYKLQKIVEIGDKKQKRLKINGKIYLRLLFYLQNFFSIQKVYSFEQNQIYEMVQYSRQQVPFNSSQFQIYPSLESLALILIYYEKCFKSVKCFYQDGFSNIWIIKSNHSSRGRNISLVNDIKNIQSLDNGMKLIQKYLQNIWILHELTESQKQNHPEMVKLIKKKFDIRFWVLVKSFSPLNVYIYDEAYLRISSQQYQLDFLNEKNSHLTNFSINWKVKNQGVEEQSFILFSKFKKFLKEQKNQDISKITLSINQIILETLKLVDIKEDQRCFQLFGFDIILDAELNPWVLECNMSPACSPRGELKSTLKNMTQGLLSLMGFIDGNILGWRSLTDGKKGYEKIKNNSRTLKQLKIDNKSINRSTIANWNDMLVSGRKLQIKNYKILEMLHYITEKVIYIQRRIRQKILRESKNDSNQRQIKRKGAKMGRILKIIQTLAKISKKCKKINFGLLIKVPRNKGSLRMKISNAIKQNQ